MSPLKVQVKHIELSFQCLRLHQMPSQYFFHHQLLRLIGAMPVFAFQILIAVLHYHRRTRYPFRRCFMSGPNKGRCHRLFFRRCRKQRFKSYNILCHSGTLLIAGMEVSFPATYKMYCIHYSTNVQKVKHPTCNVHNISTKQPKFPSFQYDLFDVQYVWRCQNETIAPHLLCAVQSDVY